MRPTDPIKLSVDEKKEIAMREKLWERSGVENADDMLDVLDQSYCVKFSFMSGGPGYYGDLFIIQPDTLDGAPISLTRGQNRKLVEVEQI